MTFATLIDPALEDVGDAAKTLAVGRGASDFVDIGRYRPRTRRTCHRSPVLRAMD